jgi:hypothetical protein
MNHLKLKTKHDKSHGWIAMLVGWFFGVRTTGNRKIIGIKKELKSLNGLKTNNALHNHPFLCLYPQNNQFKKKT